MVFPYGPCNYVIITPPKPYSNQGPYSRDPNKVSSLVGPRDARVRSQETWKNLAFFRPVQRRENAAKGDSLRVHVPYYVLGP